MNSNQEWIHNEDNTSIFITYFKNGDIFSKTEYFFRSYSALIEA